MKKYADNVSQKVVLELYLILVESPNYSYSIQKIVVNDIF